MYADLDRKTSTVAKYWCLFIFIFRKINFFNLTKWKYASCVAHAKLAGSRMTRVRTNIVFNNGGISLQASYGRIIRATMYASPSHNQMRMRRSVPLVMGSISARGWQSQVDAKLANERGKGDLKQWEMGVAWWQNIWAYATNVCSRPRHRIIKRQSSFPIMPFSLSVRLLESSPHDPSRHCRCRRGSFSQGVSAERRRWIIRINWAAQYVTLWINLFLIFLWKREFE